MTNDGQLDSQLMLDDDDPPEPYRFPDSVLETLTKSIFKDGQFCNPWSTWREPTFKTLLHWKMIAKAPESKYPKIPSPTEASQHLCCGKPNFVTRADFSRPGDVSDRLSCTWLGHATCVVEMDGVALITDPVFSSHCAPMQWIMQNLESLLGSACFRSVRRFTEPGCCVADLPDTLRFVLISHNHYDHLDAESCEQIANKFGDRIVWCVPKGLKPTMEAILPKVPPKCIYEFDWWDGKVFKFKCNRGPAKAFSIVATPSQHWSFRQPLDKNKSLWSGWCVIGPSKRKFYFAGDTGYCNVFKEIGRAFDNIDLAAIPIGAFEPRIIMEPQHVGPEEALKIHTDINSHMSFGVHWGTFPMADEGFMEPEVQLMNLVGYRGDAKAMPWKQLPSSGQKNSKSLTEMVKESKLDISFVTINCGQTYDV